MAVSLKTGRCGAKLYNILEQFRHCQRVKCYGIFYRIWRGYGEIFTGECLVRMDCILGGRGEEGERERGYEE